MGTISDEKIIEWLEENYKELYSYEDIEDHHEWELNDYYGDVKIGDLSYTAGKVLRKVDPVGFRCGVNDLINAEYVELADGDKYATDSDYEEAVEALSEGESED